MNKKITFFNKTKEVSTNLSNNYINKRIPLIDEIRGLSVLFMIIFHTIYQSVFVFSLSESILDHPFIDLIQFIPQLLFISIASVSCVFSKNNFKRGLLCLLYGTIITLVTYLFVPSDLIILGILHFLGLAILLQLFLIKFLKKIKPLLGGSTCLILFIVLYQYIVIDNQAILHFITNSSFLMNIYDNGWLTLLGFPSPTFHSSDFFSLLPWFFLFLTGYFIGELIKPYSQKEFFTKSRSRFLVFLGQYSLIIYMLHIPILLLILYGIKWISI